MTDSENLEECWLDDEVREELLTLQNECIFMWVNNAGQPFGVTMSYKVILFCLFMEYL